MSSNTARNLRFVALLLTLLLALVLGFLTLVPLNVPKDMPGNDKHHHLVAFAALALPTAALTPRLLWGLLPMLALYGVLIEVLQPFVGRNGDLGDALADGLGLLLGSILGLLMHRPLKRSLAQIAAG
ncbi:MAG: teicoplanin resistance protein VanZ [Limimaricola soesokkakensis]|uniref:teicoplanin resistance protein VanZ n=1 Tax=Limimaricola soesokkakensis TaxID=1343159 RepID=UPI004059AFE8